MNDRSAPKDASESATTTAKVPAAGTAEPRIEEALPTLETLQIQHKSGWFFEGRPELKAIYDAARARLIPPFALLGAVMARVLCEVPANVVLPDIIGAEASLNLFIALVGPSGSGKSVADTVAAQLVSSSVPSINLGSGEGITRHYARNVKAKDGGVEHLDIHTPAIVWKASEIDGLKAVGNRQGSTLLSTLRSMWVGEPLGFGYADHDKAVKLPDHSYRAAVIVGVQPGRAEWLLTGPEADGGTPQRFLWLPATDPTLGDELLDDLEWSTDMAAPRASKVAEVAIRLPSFDRLFKHPRTFRQHLPVCQAAVYDITEAAIKRARGEEDALDGHALLQQLKVAAALGLMNGRAEVSQDDWHMAGLVMEVSDAQRRDLIALHLARAREVSQRRREERVETAAASARASESALHQTAVERVSARIEKRLWDEALWQAGQSGWATTTTIRRWFSGADRTSVPEALDSLLAKGLIEQKVEPINGTQTRSLYRVKGRTR